MSERYIEVGERKWKSPTAEAAVRWRLSAKGNPYTTHKGFALVVVENRFKPGVWQYMVKPASAGDDVKWEIYGKFETQEQAKEAALAALNKGNSVVVESSRGDGDSATESVDLRKRKILLGEVDG